MVVYHTIMIHIYIYIYTLHSVISGGINIIGMFIIIIVIIILLYAYTYIHRPPARSLRPEACLGDSLTLVVFCSTVVENGPCQLTPRALPVRSWKMTSVRLAP